MPDQNIIISPSDALHEPDFFQALSRRYSGATPEAFLAVLCPIIIPIESIDYNIFRVPGENHYRASFTALISAENQSVLQRGRTGKFVPAAYIAGGAWSEIAKGRIISVDYITGIASGEIYTGATRQALARALEQLSENDFLEIDQYGAAAKVLSGLAEYYLAKLAQDSGYTVRRMPEDMARHLGAYPNYDFEFEKNGTMKRVEVKSLWGTNTAYARLIHSTTTAPRGDQAIWTPEQIATYYPTSSCKFVTQDIFAVSLFLRTGDITSFAFARSVPIDEQDYGLPRNGEYPNHVNQNPLCAIGDGSWFETIDEVWDLD